MPFGVRTTRNFWPSRRVLTLMMFFGAFLVLEVRSGHRRTMVVSAESNEFAIGNIGKGCKLSGVELILID
jgi:hypothetical protein